MTLQPPDALPVQTEDIKSYIRQYEKDHPNKKVPENPSSRWFKRDSISECMDRCKYELFQEAMKESGMSSISEKPNESQRIIHSRYAALQSQCSKGCNSVS